MGVQVFFLKVPTRARGRKLADRKGAAMALIETSLAGFLLKCNVSFQDPT
jgi:hypothetical protein